MDEEEGQDLLRRRPVQLPPANSTDVPRRQHHATAPRIDATSQSGSIHDRFFTRVRYGPETELDRYGY